MCYSTFVVGGGRDHNFLQWGFSAPPSKMTSAGGNLFINCVCYIAKFKGGAARPAHFNPPVLTDRSARRQGAET
jgi:hypothetical protein